MNRGRKSSIILCAGIVCGVSGIECMMTIQGTTPVGEGSTSRGLRIGGIILCGGRSTRMGTPKALLPFGDETLLARMVRIVGEVVSPIVVVAAAGQDLPTCARAVIVARDERPERGPLEGLRAGLAALAPHAEGAYVSSVDAPLLSPAFIRRMIDRLEDADVAVPVEEQEGKLFHHPLAGVYRTRVLPQVEALLAADRLRMVYLFEQVATNRVPVEALRDVDAELWSLRNMNDPSALRELLALAGLSAS
jgi:molybdenum cofactor guanylyltransferase